MKCPKCKAQMKEATFDIGYNLEVNSLHCAKCGFNITEEQALNKALESLKNEMAKEVKVIEIGTGLGIRFPNQVVKQFKLKKGEEIVVKSEKDGLKLIPVQ